MRFGVLGPVEVWDGQRRLVIGGPQQRGLLAVLLLHANRVVSADRLVDHLWGDDPPATARGLLQGCIAGLRRALRHTGADRLETVPPGYRLRVAPDEYDVERFERLATEAGHSQDPVRAADLLTEALSQWRGPALDGVELASCRAEAARLEERRLSVLEQRIDLDLRLGRQAGLVGELQALVAAHPLRERLWGQLMQALYEVDRRADALDAYQRLRRILVEQLGVEPAASIQQLHRTILAGGDPIADRRSGAPVNLAVPAQLPAAASAFAGRAGHLKRLDGLLPAEDGPRVAVISGMAGVGKTALALYWGQRVRERFPDGQLYVNLRGHAPPSPMPAIEALASFLQALGVPAEQVPVDLEQAAALYRSLLADKQMLVLLDDAHNLKQARPLLPGGRGCVVLVTSRDRLGGLVAIEGAAHLDLDVLDPDEARELLARVLGPEPIQAEPQAAAELARLCGYLPLALRVAAANLSLRPQLRITDHVTQLAAGDRLGELAVDQDETAAVRVAFDHSYAALPADARRLFRLLGLAPGPHLTADATAALAGTAPEPAGRLLERLARAHLIYQTATDRYTLHDLIRLYAVDRAHQEDTVADRGSAAGRLFAWYLATIDAAARLLYPESLRLPGPEPAWEPRRFDDHPAALAWLEAERPNLLAAVQHTAEHGPYAVAYLLANALTGFYMLRMYTVEWLAIANAGLAAAQADQHPLAEAVMELSLGGVSMRLARPERAAEHYTRALSLGEQTGWMELQGWTLNGLGMVNRRLQRLPEAVDCFSRAEEVNRRFGWLAGQAASVANLGIVYGELGRLRQAADCLGEALVLFRQLGSRGKEAHVLGALGEVCHQLGRLDDAADHLTRAQELVGDVGDRSLLTMIERLLAEVHRDAGRLPQALQLAQRTLALVREIEELSLESGMLTTVGSIYHQLGRYPQALVHHQQARRLAQQTDGRPHEVMALVGIADAQHRLGRLAEASDAAREAVALARAGAYRVEEGNALTTLAAIEVTAGRLAEGVTHAEQALVIHRETGHRLGEARALRELGNGQQRRGDTDAAAVSRRRAVTLFVEIGSPEAEQVRALAGAG